MLIPAKIAGVATVPALIAQMVIATVVVAIAATITPMVLAKNKTSL